MYELCCDMIDLLINMSEIYGKPNGNIIGSIDDEKLLNGEQFESDPEDPGNIEHSTTNGYSEGEHSNPNSKKIEKLFSKK